MIRPVELIDAPVLFELIDKNRARLREWLPWLDMSKHEQDTRFFIEFASKARLNGQRFDAVMIHEGNIVGMLGYNKIDRQASVGAIGCWLDEAHSGKGILSKCLVELIDVGFYNLGLETLEIRASPRNNRSCNVTLKAGFEFRGTQKNREWLYDHHEDTNIYALPLSKYRNEA